MNLQDNNVLMYESADPRTQRSSSGFGADEGEWDREFSQGSDVSVLNGFVSRPGGLADADRASGSRLAGADGRQKGDGAENDADRSLLVRLRHEDRRVPDEGSHLRQQQETGGCGGE